MGQDRCHCIKKEFKWSNFLLGHSHPGRFVRSQWRGPVWLYLMYRVVVATYFLTWTIISVVEFLKEMGSEGYYWIVFFNNWCTILLVSNLLYQVVVVAYYAFHKDNLDPGLDGEDRMSQPLKLLWVWTDVAYSATYVSIMLFWDILPGWHISSMTAASVNVQIVSTWYVTLDLLITGHPIRIFHFFEGLLFGVTYIVFYLVYSVVAGATIYETLDWSEIPGQSTVTCLLLLVSFLVAWLVVWLVYRVRMCLARCLPCGVVTEPEVDAEQEEIIQSGDSPAGGITGLDHYGATDDLSSHADQSKTIETTP